MTQFHDDPLDDLLSTTTPVTTHRAPPASYAAPEQTFEEPCGKCRGRGRFISYSGRDVGQCFTCKGTGKRVFRTSREDRARSTASATARRERNADTNLADFATAEPVVHAWVVGKAGSFEFARSLLDAVRKHGSLTDNQLAAVHRCIAKDVERNARQLEQATARVQAQAEAPQVDTAGVDRLKAAFDHAIANAATRANGLTLRHPKITLNGITISPAKAGSANAGALYAKAGQTYLGKIVGGKFFPVSACTPEQQAQVVAFVSHPDPAEAARVYGQETGICCICNATLISKWRLRGIGPICAQKFGW